MTGFRANGPQANTQLCMGPLLRVQGVTEINGKVRQAKGFTWMVLLLAGGPRAPFVKDAKEGFPLLLTC